MAAAVNQTGQSMRNVVGLCLVDVKAATVITLKICRFGIVNVLMGVLLRRLTLEVQSVLVIFAKALMSVSVTCRGRYSLLPTL